MSKRPNAGAAGLRLKEVLVETTPRTLAQITATPDDRILAEMMSIVELRSQYEEAVLALRSQVVTMRNGGLSSEAIARVVHAERRRLAAVFKERTPEPLRSRISIRTISLYGDPAGPTVEYLRADGKSWENIIESATRPGVPDLRAVRAPASRAQKHVCQAKYLREAEPDRRPIAVWKLFQPVDLL